MNNDEVQEMMQAYDESSDDANRIFSAAIVGNKDGPHGIMTVHIRRGNPDDSFPDANDSLLTEYKRIREVLLEGLPADPPYHEEEKGYDIGDVKDAFFVLVDDCTALEPPIIAANDFPIHDEWNALMNQWNDDVKVRIKEIWDRRKLTFDQLYQKVKEMKIAPPNPNAKYFWYDRTM
jgi:hypothetical protein